MAFEGLSERLQAVMKKLRGKGKVTEADVKTAMREVRLALLEADVNFKVVKTFINRVKERAIGQEVLQSLTPGQQVIKVVREELTALMGGQQSELMQSKQPPTVVMMVGLQGAGKTTTTGKLARLLKKQKHHRPLLIAADIYRPAAIKQLQVIGEQLEIPIFAKDEQTDPVQIVTEGLAQARENNHDFVLIDTAGRLHIDETMMEELKQVREAVNPDEILLVVDAMTGQDAVNVAENFNRDLTLTGIVLTKLDGDTRGGAALSVKEVTNCPIKFVGMGEKMDALEPFHPDRMAQRILGMGDIISLIEKAEQAVDKKKMKELEKKMQTLSFTFDDFLEQLQQVRNMGPLEDMLAMLPGAGKIKGMKNLTIDEKQLNRVEAIIQSMTSYEKSHPEMINASRRKRIAKGSGVTVQDVNRLLKQFADMKKMMKKFSTMTKGGKKKRFKFPFSPF